uniref:Uncharacterized protein n=1 Tax=Amphora coffeiformis TaxID=265554 RepID=A0A7S3P4H7_9STRA
MSKSVNAPRWATESNLIGYTSSRPIPNGTGTGDLLQQLIREANERSEAPSIYYQDGHATIDHSMPGNIGWEDMSNSTCLFFGNVPESHLERFFRCPDSIKRRWVRENLRRGMSGTLLEVWEMPGGLGYHPSRNPIHFVNDPHLRSRLHAVATDPNVMRMLRSGRQAQEKRRGRH